MRGFFMNKQTEFERRLSRHYDELKWLYCELYPGREDLFHQLCTMLEGF